MTLSSLLMGPQHAPQSQLARHKMTQQVVSPLKRLQLTRHMTTLQISNHLMTQWPPSLQLSQMTSCLISLKFGHRSQGFLT